MWKENRGLKKLLDFPKLAGTQRHQEGAPPEQAYRILDPLVTYVCISCVFDEEVDELADLT